MLVPYLYGKYRKIPNKRAGRDCKKEGAFIMFFLCARRKYLLYRGCFSPIFDLETLGGTLIRDNMIRNIITATDASVPGWHRGGCQVGTEPLVAKTYFTILKMN